MPQNPKQSKSGLELAAQWLCQTDYLVVAAGAGLGVDSGLPDFRGSEGLWRAYPGLKRSGYRFEEIANPKAFIDKPLLAWGFYGHRLKLYRDTQPNEAYRFFLDFLKTRNGFVFTSNVDGQFQKAGYPEKFIYEVHGSIHYLQCLKPCSDSTWSAKSLAVSVDFGNSQWIGALPECLNCQSLARPNILMFSDWSYVEPDRGADLFRLHTDLKKARFPVVVELGAGKAVATVRYFSEGLGIPLIRINPRDYDIPHRVNGVGLAMGAVEAVKHLRSVMPEGLI